MRTLGLIGGYALALFLTGWLLMNVDFKSVWAEDGFLTEDLLKQYSVPVPEKSQLESVPDSLWTLQSWLKRPIGIVRYPDFPPINFLPNGD